MNLSEKAQGSLEYMLIFAGALSVSALVLFYLFRIRGVGGGAIENQSEDIENQLG